MPQRSTAHRPPSSTMGRRPAPTKFAGYRVEAMAGRGGMGVVYKATQLGLDRPVALKVIAAGLLGDPRIRERFLRESRAAAAIEHPNVIPIHDAGEHHGRPYIAMRFVDGDDLRERVTRDRAARARARRGDRRARSPPRSTPRTRPGSSTATSSRRTSCSAPHGQRLPHRLRAREPRALRRRADRARAAGSGTLDYMAPEQIRGERVDGRADVYALGCVLHFALTGQVRLPARDRRGAAVGAPARRAARSPRGSRAGVPGGVRRGRSRARSPSGRKRVPPSAGELGAAAARGRRAPGGRARQAHGGIPPPAAQRRRRDVGPTRRAAAALGAGVLAGRRGVPPAAAGAVAAVLLTHEPGTPPGDRRAAGDHDDRGRAPAKPPARQGARRPGPARRPHGPRRPAAGQRRGRRRQRVGRQHRLARRSTGSPLDGHHRHRGPAPRLRHHGHHQPARRAVGDGGRLRARSSASAPRPAARSGRPSR